jgi:hypothetical protein
MLTIELCQGHISVCCVICILVTFLWVIQIRKMLKENEPSKCLFNDCVHLGEHGCVVKGDWERYPYYLQMLDEIKIREEIQLRTFGTKKEGDVRYATYAHPYKH